MASSDDELVKRLLRLHRSLRYCAVIDDGNVVSGGMRSGVKSLEPASEDPKLMTQFAILLGADKEWDSYMGKTDYFLIRKIKVNLVFYPMRETRGLLISSNHPLPLTELDGIRKTLDGHEKH